MGKVESSVELTVPVLMCGKQMQKYMSTADAIELFEWMHEHRGLMLKRSLISSLRYYDSRSEHYDDKFSTILRAVRSFNDCLFTSSFRSKKFIDAHMQQSNVFKRPNDRFFGYSSVPPKS